MQEFATSEYRGKLRQNRARRGDLEITKVWVKAAVRREVSF
jgi:hypothetical protein